MKWRDQDSTQRAVTVGIWSCVIAVIAIIVGIAVNLYTWSHPVDINHPPVIGIPTWFWALLGTWGPTLLSCGGAIAALVAYRGAKSLPQPVAILMPASDLDEAKRKLAKAVNDLDVMSKDNKKLADQVLRLERMNGLAQKKLSDSVHNYEELTKENVTLKQYIEDHIDVQLILHEKKPFTFDPKRQNLRVHSVTSVDLEIVRHKTNDLHGLILYIVNHTDQWIGSYNARIVDINGWSDTHKKFLPTKDFAALPLNNGKDIGPMQRSGSAWIVNHQFLPAIDGHLQPPLKLPGNKPLDWNFTEPASTELWRFSVEYTFLQGQTHHQQAGSFVIQWNRTIGQLDFASDSMTEQ